MTLKTSVVALATAALFVGAVPSQAAQRGRPGGGGGRPGPGPAPSAGRAVPRGVTPPVFHGGPVRFVNPYYVFRPRLSLGLGLWSGYPIGYPAYYGYYTPYYGYGLAAGYGYGYGYYPYVYGTAYPPGPYSAYPYMAYPYPGLPYPGAPYSTNTNPYPSGTYAYPPAAPGNTQAAPPPNSLSVQPGQQQPSMGGLSFEIEPSTAEVVVDGKVMGTVGQFTPSTQPLGIPAGLHRIQIRADGYRTIDFDVDVVAGEVIPYKGTLER